MPPDDLPPLVAIDVGNSRIKFGRFDSLDATPLPVPSAIVDVHPDDAFDALQAWVEDGPSKTLSWYIASVNSRGATRVIDWLREQDVVQPTTILASFDLPLTVRLERPDLVGIDRLLGAVAANRLREPDRPAVVVDLGTAITVDLVSAAGEFLGGAILPGISMSARAMHQFTDRLPLVDMAALGEAPPALGRSTVEAMTAGLYWGAVGGVRNLVKQYGQAQGGAPHVLVTGGAGPAVAHLISEHARFVPHLTLAGIAAAVAG